MKLFTLAAAGVVAMTGLAPALVAPVAAQRTVVTERTVEPEATRHTVVTERTVVRHREDRGWRNRRVCTVRWHHGHRVRVCRVTRWH